MADKIVDEDACFQVVSHSFSQNCDKTPVFKIIVFPEQIKTAKVNPKMSLF